jgi:hypothetical protein
MCPETILLAPHASRTVEPLAMLLERGERRPPLDVEDDEVVVVGRDRDNRLRGVGADVARIADHLLVHLVPDVVEQREVVLPDRSQQGAFGVPRDRVDLLADPERHIGPLPLRRRHPREEAPSAGRVNSIRRVRHEADLTGSPAPSTP